MADLEYLKRNVFPGESGGDYNALYGYSNRPGGAFSGVRLTDMTVNDALAFSSAGGPYGQWSKNNLGYLATPMGAYQVVGSTLREAAKGLGLTGNERMTPELQDAIGMWIYQNQGPGAWEAWGGGGGGGTVTASTKGAPMGLLNFQDEQRPQSFLERLGIQRRDPAAGGQTALPFYQRDNFNDALGSLGATLMSLDMATKDMAPFAFQQVQARKDKRSEEEKRNRTAEVLAQIAPEAAALFDAGLVNPSEALAITRDQRAREVASEAAAALARGDYQTAYALSLELSPAAAGQAIAQQFGPRPAEITGNGMYTVTYENGVPKITVNEEVQQAELDRIRTEAEVREANKPAPQPPAAVVKSEEEDFGAIDTLDQLNADLGGIIQLFGRNPQTGEFEGPLQIGPGGAISGALGYMGVGQSNEETRLARASYERFVTRYVNDSLRLNSGVQTEGDAVRAAAELGNAMSTEAAYAALVELARINERARQIKERAITGRRERYGLDPATVPAAPAVPGLEGLSPGAQRYLEGN